MKKNILNFCFLIFATAAFSQAGHIMQGVGAVNMSMGGASTAQPLDISGALQWNPASISTFDSNILKFDIGLFFSSPELFSTVPTPGGPFSGNTEDDRGVSPMPALAMVWGKEDSKHTFGASAFGISGFGVTFPESMTNPINNPQPNGFGRVESDYMLLQVGFTWAYEISDQFSIGVEPTFNYAALDLMPNPTANPGQYSTGDNNKFDMDYPSILSFGLGYSKGDVDLAVDYRMVDYENTNGFEASGWTQTASVAGFGWENISILSAGIQYKGIDKLPLRVGYTYSSNPITEELAFFSVPATAIIKNAFQFGFSYEASENLSLDAVYHYGSSGGKTAGQILNPGFIGNGNPLGAIPGSEVSYDMTTSMIMVGFSYTFNKKEVATK